jgi:hypothetical protein
LKCSELKVEKLVAVADELPARSPKSLTCSTSQSVAQVARMPENPEDLTVVEQLEDPQE